MKKIVSIFFLLFCLIVQGNSQNFFEGTIKWNITTVYTDPAQEQELRKTIATLSSPEGQKKMKEMELQLNNPALKQYFDSNQVMKTKLEQGLSFMKLIQQSPNEDPMKLLLSKECILKTKMNAFKLERNIKDSLSTNIVCDSSGTAYTVNDKYKTYSIIKKEKDTIVFKQKIVATKVTEKIVDYKCNKYIIEIEKNGKKINHQVWVSDNTKSINPKALTELDNQGSGIDFSMIKGIPLKMIIVGDYSILTFIASELKEEKLNSSVFKIPNSYKKNTVREARYNLK